MTATPTTSERDFTPANVESAYQAVLAALPAREAPEPAWLACFERWNELKRWVDGESARRQYRERQDTRDAGAAEAARMVREEIDPLLEPFEARLRGAFLEAGCRPALEARLGKQLFERFTIAQAAYEPSNIPLRVTEGQIVADYMRLLGSAQVELDGESLTFAAAQARLGEPDAARRESAWRAMIALLERNADHFHDIYDQLVRVRHEMARNLGEETFIPLAYRRMARTDYGPDEVARFREEIRQHVVPVMARLRAWQARELGVAALAPWDTEFYPGLSLPPGIVPVDRQLDQMQVLFDRLDPRMAAHARTMVARGLIDLPTRPGKTAGAFCSSFEDKQEAAVLCNSTGNAGDVITLTHEMGHAMQVWESFPIPAVDLRWPGMDAAEVHSMGLELLALPEIEAFFTPADAARYRRLVLVNVLVRLPYMAVVDAFQHWVYSHPEHTHAEREATWDRLWREFMPPVDESRHPLPHRTRWMRQLHVFKHPFYYIDYAIAECGALQLWELAERDHAAAMDGYFRLCALGGTLPLVAFFEAGGLKSPFTPGLLGPLMARLTEALAL